MERELNIVNLFDTILWIKAHSFFNYYYSVYTLDTNVKSQNNNLWSEMCKEFNKFLFWIWAFYVYVLCIIVNSPELISWVFSIIILTLELSFENLDSVEKNVDSIIRITISEMEILITI